MTRKKGLTWTPYFHLSKKQSVTERITWRRQDVRLLNAKDEVYFEMKGVEAPEFWSPLAVDIAASKYFRKKGVPGRRGAETSVKQMVERVSSSLQSFAQSRDYFVDRKAGQAFQRDLEFLLYHQHGSFNSPVWFNAGLAESYGIRSKSQCYAWDFRQDRVVMQEEAYTRPQISACFIQKIEDNLDSIFNLVKNEARLFKFGSGSGTNFSDLRSRYEQLAGGGTSSGVLSFLEVLDRSAGSVKSGGTTRRAAKMVILDIDHPEIEDFIHWKEREEQKAKVLIAAGYDSHFEGEAYRTVSGQNSNNSVRVTDRFMSAVRRNADWDLRDRLTGRSVRKLKARDLWNQIAEAAWACADPGVQFHDTINHWHTCPQTGEIRASNPCSEYLFIDDSACNLASLNLLRFLDENDQFKLEDFRQAARTFFLAQEIFVDMASYPTEAIAQNSHDYRPLGLGFTGFGAFLMRQGVAYDSDLARAWGASLTALLTGYAYELSGEVARTQGPFAGWKKNKASMAKVMGQHRSALKSIPWSLLPVDLKGEAQRVWEAVVAASAKNGFRNAQATVVAPTGTISFIMDSETTGIEPEYALVRFKSLAGGGTLRLTSPSVEVSLKRLLYSDEERAQILKWIEDKGSLKDCKLLRPGHSEIFATALEIEPRAHLKMMAAVQAFVSGAISKTVNLPAETTARQIGDLYAEAYEMGLKAVAIYRDQSKGFQPLQTKPEKKNLEETLTKAAVPSPEKGTSSRLKLNLESPVTSPLEMDLPECFECGTVTELSGGCFRCPNCGTVIGCS